MNDTWIEIPELYGAMAFFKLEKGLSHKYLKRVPTGNPKRPWRYYYKLVGGAGRLLNAEHFKTHMDEKRGLLGSSFADAEIGKRPFRIRSTVGGIRTSEVIGRRGTRPLGTTSIRRSVSQMLSTRKIMRCIGLRLLHAN